MNRVYYLLIYLLLTSFSAPVNAINDQIWYSYNEDKHPIVNLYFYWSKKCPHCLEAVPFVEQLNNKYSWLHVFSRELTEHPEHIEQYITMTSSLGQDVNSVPAFMWCGGMFTGYDNPDNVGKYLEQSLLNCYEWLKDNNKLNNLDAAIPAVESSVTIPMLGRLSLTEYSLPVYTIILAGIDAFNPCAFFVLLFLLSFMVHAKSRKRMLIIGGIFVLFSGVMYFLFMTAWLNVFLMMGNIDAITFVAGLVAVIIASINIKDFFWFKQGVSLSISDSARASLYQRARKLITAGSLPAMIIATAGLALFANLYEFLCTAGFPMVFTRILTMAELPTYSYYLYLVFYNIIYVVPLLIIVVVFSLTFGMRKLQEEQGRILKLLSGCMMMLLGLILVVVPEWLNSIVTAVAILLAALLLTWIIVYIDRKHRLK